MLRILEPIAIMLAAWLRRTCGHCTEVRSCELRRAVNLSYSSETLGSSPARLSIAGALSFVEGST